MKCEVSWCVSEAAWSWIRTPEERKAMSTKRVTVGAEFHVCGIHKPAWRDDVYVSYGTAVAVAVAPVAVKRKAKHCAGCACGVAA